MRIFDIFWNLFFLRYYRVLVGDNFKCDGKLIVQGRGGQFVIGNNVHIISKEMVNPIGGNRTVLQSLGNGRITIGNNVGLSHAIICARDSVTIEDDVMVGAGVKIYDNDFHSIEYEYRMLDPDKHVRKGPVVIREGAFIGAHSIILKNVTIGKHSVVGAGSVVTKNIPDGELWAGNPARFIRTIEKP